MCKLTVITYRNLLFVFGMFLIPVYMYLSVRIMPLTCRLTSSSAELIYVLSISTLVVIFSAPMLSGKSICLVFGSMQVQFNPRLELRFLLYKRKFGFGLQVTF